MNVKVSHAPPVPDSWPLITGDILTNVRAALDHAIYPHVRATAPSSAPHRIQYPIVDTADDFVSKTTGWFTPEVRAVAEDRSPISAITPAITRHGYCESWSTSTSIASSW